MAAAWEGLDGPVAVAVEEQSLTALGTYQGEPRRVGQDANIERAIAEGAYAKRQLFELIQNSADAIRGETSGGRCEVVLTKDCLYVANNGEPFTVDGVIALMGTHDSVKRDDKIGRFGLGFKSLLAVTDSPRVFSRTGSFVFDREESRQVLSRTVPGLEHYPVMRWARAVDPTDASQGDDILRKLMKWASTVVVAPIKPGNSVQDLLAGSLKGFPAEFLLFSQHVERLDLEDRHTGAARTIRVNKDDAGSLVLDNAGKKSVWIVRSQRHHPSKEALADGGYSAARDSVELTWAAPLEGAPKGVGTFWAYFPTISGTTLSGIVNAPWKLADDRESLLSGRFNDELLTEVLPGLVADALPAIHSAERPTLVLDVLPARGKEARNHADNVLNKPVMDRVASGQCIPNMAGALRHPSRIRLHPDGLLPEELEIWASAGSGQDRWVSHAVISAEHRAKVARLLGSQDRVATHRQWLEDLAKDGGVDGSIAAVRIVASLMSRAPSPELAQELSKTRVLLLDDGTLHACRPGEVFLPGEVRPGGALTIDPLVAADARAVESLGQLGIKIFDNAGELRSELTAPAPRWERVWASSRKNTVDEAVEIFRDVLGDALLDVLRVRTFSGKWKRPGDVYLAGPVIPADGSRDVDFLVDPRFHQQDHELLLELGLRSAPTRLANPPMETWRQAKLDGVREAFRRQSGQSRMPDSAIDIDQGRVLWPLDPLPRLSEAGRWALTAAALKLLIGDERWRITRIGGASAQKSVQDGTWLYLREHGRLETQIGIQPVSRCLRWSDDLAVIDAVEQPLPFASLSDDHAIALGLKDAPSELSDKDWAAILDQSRAWESDRRFLAYAWAAYLNQSPPARLKVVRGPGFVEVPPEQVAVTHRKDVFDSLVAAGVPTIRTSSEEDFETLRDNWGLADGGGMLTETVDYESAGESYSLVDRFPPLRLNLPVDQHDLTVQPCKRLEILTATPGGQQSRAVGQFLEDRIVYLTAAEDRDILTQVARALEADFRPDKVLERMEEQRRNKLRQLIAGTDDVLDKLALAIGVEALRQSVPSAALEGLKFETGRELKDRELAQLALAVDGYSVLQNHVPALSRKGLEPPSVWAGRRNAREWVRQLGFPLEFAGFSGVKREAEIEVDGPSVLGELHDYQRGIADHVKGLLNPASEVRRGLLPLPTGAGKTRVAVQALVEHMADSEAAVRVLWLAETDELCEQATQTWSQVWRAKGRPGVPMTLSRLWASNEPQERDGHQVVVASLAKLDSIVKRNDGDWKAAYGWLVEPTIIVVDEAHRSVGQQYTRTLSALGGTKRVAEMTTPILGLTATPFRGFNVAETEQLASRYHRNLLDTGIFPGDDVYGYLQAHGVLARIEHRLLKGADLVLTDDELAHATTMRRLPDSVENRLGQNDERNAEIVRAVLELEEQETALLFATSVENARALAALLTYNGLEARAVAATTDPHARRRYVEDFKAKRVRVLTNYNVFTEGFDVPKVDAVFITRPTFSPNVYQQMIGRGLRGPLNGGKERVKIVNVEDNLTNYGEEFAFRHFEYLWGRAGK